MAALPGLSANLSTVGNWCGPSQEVAKRQPTNTYFHHHLIKREKDISTLRKDDLILRIKEKVCGNSLAVQWLGLHAFTAKGLGSVPGRGTRIPQAVRCGQKQKKSGRPHILENIAYDLDGE